MSVRSEVVSQFERVAAEQDRKLAPLRDELLLTDSGLDSLCFAIVVSRLEDTLGLDPFSAADQATAPQTLGEFIRLYENASR